MSTSKRKAIKQDWDKLEFMYRVMQDKQKYSADTFTALTSKMNFLFAFTGAATAFYATLMMQSGFLDLQNTPAWLFYLRLAAFVGLIGVLSCLCIAAKLRRFSDAPAVNTIYSQDSWNRDFFELKNQVVADMVECHLNNQKANEDIAYWLKNALWSLLITLLLIMVALIF